MEKLSDRSGDRFAERHAARRGGQVRDGVPDAAYASRTLLDEHSLATVHSANLAFLGLVVEAGRAATSGGVYALPTRTTLRLMSLTVSELAAIARCTYSLYTLKFADADFWRSVVAEVVAQPAGALGVASPHPPPGSAPAFTRTAVFLAWHLARGSDLTAALVLGMTPGVQEAWRGLPLSGIERAAAAAVPFLEARWGEHSRFWPGLLEVAEDGDEEAAERVRLLGLQLLATDGLRPHLSPRRQRRL
jgi:hypothetical protein